MRINFRIIVAAAACFIAVSASRPALAENYYIIRFESRELIFDIGKQIVSSAFRTRVNGTDFDIKADRIQFDFRSNMLRASGDVEIHYEHRIYPGLPNIGELDAQEDFIFGRELVLNAEFGEAIIYPENPGGAPVMMDLATGRFVPQLKRVGEMPAWIPPPESDIVICFEITYGPSEKFYMYDATYIPAGAPQLYTALLVADGPDLVRRTAVVRNIYGNKGYFQTFGNTYEPVGTGYFEGTVWLRNNPRSATFLDLEYMQSDKQGFALLTPTLTRTASLNAFSAIALYSENEISRTGSLTAMTYTGSRNEFGASWNRETDNHHNDLWDTSYRTSYTDNYAFASIWDDSYRLNGYYEDELYSNSGDKKENTRYRYAFTNFRLDPVRTPLGNYRFGLDIHAYRQSNREMRYITGPDSYLSENIRTNGATLTPMLIYGPDRIAGDLIVIQKIEYNASYSSTHAYSYVLDSGVSYYSNGDDFHSSDFSFDSQTRFLLPIDNRFMFDLTLEYGAEYSNLTPGLSYSPNGQDYLFVGMKHDFTHAMSTDPWGYWKTLYVDMMIRRKGDTRYTYSLNYDMAEQETSYENFGFLIDRHRGTLVLAYEDVNSDFRIGYFTSSPIGASGDRVLEKYMTMP